MTGAIHTSFLRIDQASHIAELNAIVFPNKLEQFNKPFNIKNDE